MKLSIINYLKVVSLSIILSACGKSDVPISSQALQTPQAPQITSSVQPVPTEKLISSSAVSETNSLANKASQDSSKTTPDLTFKKVDAGLLPFLEKNSKLAMFAVSISKASVPGVPDGNFTLGKFKVLDQMQYATNASGSVVIIKSPFNGPGFDLWVLYSDSATKTVQKSSIDFGQQATKFYLEPHDGELSLSYDDSDGKRQVVKFEKEVSDKE